MLELNWEQLEPRLRDGDEAAWTQVINTLRPGLVRYATSLGLDAELAEDAVQDGLSVAYFHITSKAAVPDWKGLFTSRVRFAVLTIRRKRQHLKREASLDATRAGTNGESGSWANEIPDHRREGGWGSDELIEMLPDEYRELFCLRYREDFTMQAIADRLGVPLATVCTRIHRGLKLLRERLGEDVPA